jgi:pimeloyl-ACP methyl ester carboxylesterase
VVEQKISGPNHFSADFYVERDATAIVLEFSLTNSHNNLEQDIFKVRSCSIRPVVKFAFDGELTVEPEPAAVVAAGAGWNVAGHTPARARKAATSRSSRMVCSIRGTHGTRSNLPPALAQARETDYGTRMTRWRFVVLLTLVVLALISAGCGRFVARRMVQAPNSYAAWMAPEARVKLAFSSQFPTNFAAHAVDVGPPRARLRYRIVDPADYQLRVSSTNWVQRGRTHFKFTFTADLPGEPTVWTPDPRGTVLLLHGYGMGEFSTAPWALRLAEDGWRCVLVDLRGHGASTGKQIHFGLTETNDLTQLLNTLARHNQLVEPVAVLGESYGASLALRWRSVEPRVGQVVAIAPYARLSTAILNIRREFAPCLPKPFITAGLRKLPSLLKVEPEELDTLTVLDRHPVDALFVAGANDTISPPAEVRRLRDQSGAGGRFLVIPGATHEALLYFFDDLVPSVLDWLNQSSDPDAA